MTNNKSCQLTVNCVHIETNGKQEIRLYPWFKYIQNINISALSYHPS